MILTVERTTDEVLEDVQVLPDYKVSLSLQDINSFTFFRLSVSTLATLFRHQLDLKKPKTAHTFSLTTGPTTREVLQTPFLSLQKAVHSRQINEYDVDLIYAQIQIGMSSKLEFNTVFKPA